MYRTVIAGLLVSLLCSPAYATQSSCDAFVHDMTGKVIAVFHDKTRNEAQKRATLSTLFQEAVDTDWIGKFVLGRFWKTASAQEQKDYLAKYRLYLTQNYVSKFDDEDGFNVDDIRLASITPTEPNQFEAKSLVLRKDEEDVHVDYLLDQSSSRCQVHDIKIEGVSLLATQRSEFQTLGASSGIKGIIDAMQKQLQSRSD